MGKSGKILALSGGGFRGLYTIRVLRKLEEHTGKPIAEQFDLITGTSIGGIIALAIAADIPLSEVEKAFVDDGHRIFHTPIKSPVKNPILRFFHKILISYRAPLALFFSIHSNKGLKRTLTKIFEDRTMADLTHAKVVIPAANLSTGLPKHFKTPHHEDIYTDGKLKVVDVALATSAAPVYFPIHEIDDLKTMFADGGLVGNAPGLFGWLEAKTRLGIAEEDICVLAVGTLAGRPSLSSKLFFRKGVWFWLSPNKLRLLTLMMAQQEQQINYMLKLLLKEDRYYRIDFPVSDEAASDIDLDDVSEFAQKTLISHAIKHFDDFTSTSFCKKHFPRGVDKNKK